MLTKFRSLNMNTGTVRWFNEEKGYGFICAADGSDIFVHQRVIKMEGFRTLVEGQAVWYTDEASDKGRRATVCLVKEPVRTPAA
jgi:CspA family cold shock protein